MTERKNLEDGEVDEPVAPPAPDSACRCYRIGDIEDATDCPLHGQPKEADA